jgi:hypothetical protein
MKHDNPACVRYCEIKKGDILYGPGFCRIVLKVENFFDHHQSKRKIKLTTLLSTGCVSTMMSGEPSDVVLRMKINKISLS